MALFSAQTIVALLGRNSGVASIVGNRIHSEEIPQSPRMPYIAVQKVDAVHEHHMLAADGVAHDRVQVDFYAKTRAQVEDLADKARLALDTFTGTVTVSGQSMEVSLLHLISDNSDFLRFVTGSDSVSKRISHDYEIWHGEVVPTFA